MKQAAFLLFAMICLYGCKHSSQQEATLTGEIKGMGNDTLYLYGMDETYDRIDTIPVENDRFAYTVRIDTVTSAFLLIDKRVEYPIFLDKGNRIEVKGESNRPEFLTINGNIYNEEFTAFQNELKMYELLPVQELEQRAETFIREHPSSFVSLYLLDKYFVQQAAPDFQKIKELTGLMTGVLQDKRYTEQLNEYIAQAEKTEIGRYAPFFNLPNAKGEKLTRTSEVFRQKYLLINFWASWADSTATRQSNTELKVLYKKYKKNKHVGMLGISLDIDREQWLAAIERDTLGWEQVCDFGGIDSDVARQYAVGRVPYNILLSTDGIVLAKNLTGENLKRKLEEVVTAAEEKERRNKKKL